MSARERPVRIHWVSPLPPQQTDIAQYTRRILPALAERAEVVLWTDTRGWDADLEDHAEVRLFDASAPVPMDLRRAAGEAGPDKGAIEAVFFHIGNSWVFHAGILHLTRKVPGIVVIHDLAIQEFLRDLIHNSLLDPPLYHQAMTRHYGAAGQRAAQAILDHGPAPETFERMPMFEITLDRATAALCHTPAGFERVSEAGLVPTYHADLPFAVGPEAGADRALEGPLRLTQFGHIGPNRRLEPILEALADVRNEVDFVFDIFGKIWDPDFIADKANELGIADRLTFRGFAPEPELDAALRAAHLVFNLRYPTMGEASGSQLRIWNASATAVVTDLGWYASVPEECVLKVPLESEVSALADTLRRLNGDRTLCARIGSAGRARLLSHHTPDRYADAIVALARCSEADARERLFVDAAAAIFDGSGTAGQALYQNRLLACLDPAEDLS